MKTLKTCQWFVVIRFVETVGNHTWSKNYQRPNSAYKQLAQCWNANWKYIILSGKRYFLVMPNHLESTWNFIAKASQMTTRMFDGALNLDVNIALRVKASLSKRWNANVATFSVSNVELRLIGLVRVNLQHNGRSKMEMRVRTSHGW